MKYLCYIPLLFFFFSCEKEPEGELLIDSIVEVEMTETPVSGTGEVLLNCKTLKEYICYKYVIGYNKAGEGNVIRINFQHVMPGTSQQCATSVGPARAKISLGRLENGDYAIELNNGKMVNKGTLEVRDLRTHPEFSEAKWHRHSYTCSATLAGSL